MALESRKQREKQERYMAILDAAEKIIQADGFKQLKYGFGGEEDGAGKRNFVFIF